MDTDALSRTLPADEPPADTQPKMTPPLTSFTTVAEDWPEEGLAAHSFASHPQCAVSGWPHNSNPALKWQRC